MRHAIKKKQVMTKFRIDELSSVTRPAQAPAEAVIMKRDTEEGTETVIRKMGWISVPTSADEGHAHIIELWPGDDKSGETFSAVGVGEDAQSHRHAWMLDDEGQIQVLMNAGHLHAVERDVVVNAVVAMVQKHDLDEETLGKIQKNFPEIESLEKEDFQVDEELKKRYEAIIALPATQRAFFDKIEKAEDQDEFLAKSADERELLSAPKVEKTEVVEPKVEKDEDPDTVYKAADGTVFTKSDDPRLVAAIIEKDSKDKEIATLKAEKADAEFEKRAELELANLPGTVAQRAELLKSVESIENPEHREAALKALQAGNSASEDVTKSLGTSAGKTVEKAAAAPGQIQKSDAEAQLDEMAKAEAVKLELDPSKPADFAKAYTIVVSSPEGKELYNKHRDAMISRTSN